MDDLVSLSEAASSLGLSTTTLVLALTGGWIWPFVEGLGLKLVWREGLVEATGDDGVRPWVIAKHPMKKPENAFVTDVLAAFEELGASRL